VAAFSVHAAAQHRDKSNDLIQSDFNFPVQACGVRMAGNSLIVLKRRIRGGRTAPRRREKMGTRTSVTRLFGGKPENAEPWTLERRLHLGLAAVAVMGWILAYAALTRGIDGSQEVARSEGAGMKVSVNLTR
jgi:hypothetical protein